MKDFNFFSEYIKKKKLANKKIGIIVAVVIVLVLFIAGSYAATEFTVFALKAGISAMNEHLNLEEVASKKQQAELTKRQLDKLKSYVAVIDSASASIDEISVINSSLIEQINRTLPASVHFKSITFSTDNFNITGLAGSRTAVAELQHNLTGLGVFKDVYVSTIQIDEAGQEFNFDIQCLLKDVSGQ